MGGKSQKTSTSTVQIPPYVEAAYKDLIAKASPLADTAYDPATARGVAGFTGPQQQAFQNTQNIQGIQNPYLTQAQQYAQSGASTISGDNIAQYLNPYQSQVIDATMSQIGRNNAMQQSELTGNAALRGALGGDRVGVAQAELARNQDMNTQNILAQMNQQNYNQALSAAQADKSRAFQGASAYGSLGNQAQQAGYQDINALLGIGGQQQALGQQQLDTASANAQQAYQHPFDQLSWLSGITTGLGSTAGSTTTQTQPGPSALSQIAGIGLTAASLFSDERVKEDIKPVGATFDGQPIYKFRYKGDPAVHMGLMAQDVEQRHPEAVGEVGGIKTVDYDRATKGFADGGWINSPMLRMGLGMLAQDGGGMGLLDAMQYGTKNGEPTKPLFPETGKAIGTTLSGMFGGPRNLSGLATGGKVNGPPSHMDDVLSRVQHAAQGLSAARKSNGGSVDVRKGIGRPVDMDETSPGQWEPRKGFANGGVSNPFAADDDLFNALLQQESGNRDIQGPLITAGANAGDRAFGPAQIMPKTAQSPGYGVAPLNPNAPNPEDENRRFGRDYLNAMLNEFGGDEEAALIAYNAGPGNAQKWLAAGRDYSVLPQRGQTEPYAQNIMAMANRGHTGISQPTATSSSPPLYTPEGGIGTPQAAESPSGEWDINLPLLAAGLGILGSDSPFPGVAIGQGGMQGVQMLMQQREAKSAAKKLADAAAAAQERLGIQRESLEETKRHNLASETGKPQYKFTKYGIGDERTGELQPYPQGAGTAPDLTPAQKAVDQAFGKEYAETIAGGGFADARKNLAQLKSVVADLGDPDGPNLTGSLLGSTPDFVTKFTHPKAIDAREKVEEVVQRNLRQILGAQFTEQEGERLISRAYNPRLPEAANAERLGRLYKAMEAAYDAKMAAADYYEQHGTLSGYPGLARVTIADLEDAIDGDGADRGQQPVSEPPAPAVQFLQQNPTPEMINQFNQKYGPGAAERILSNQPSMTGVSP